MRKQFIKRTTGKVTPGQEDRSQHHILPEADQPHEALKNGVTPQNILGLQRTIGNQAVQRLLAKNSSGGNRKPFAPQGHYSATSDPSFVQRFGDGTEEEVRIGSEFEECLQAFSEDRGQLNFYYERLQVNNSKLESLKKGPSSEELEETQREVEATAHMIEELKSALATNKTKIFSLKDRVRLDLLDPYYKPLLKEITMVNAWESIRTAGFGKLRGRESSELNTVTPTNPELLSLIESMGVKDAPINTNKTNNTTMEVGRKHDLTISNLLPGQAANVQFIRFVKATKLRGKELSCTVPGYVTFKTLHDFDKESLRQKKSLLDTAHSSQAQWSFDGPVNGIDSRMEKEDAVRIIDTPGESSTRPEHFPYILKMDFIGILYNPVTLEIVRKVQYQDISEEIFDPFNALRNVGSTKERIAENMKKAKGIGYI